MADATETIAALRQAVQQFVDERDWRQFHTPKNLSMSLAIEAAELMEHFQWLDVPASVAYSRDPAHRSQIADEMADVCCYLLSLANAIDLDLSMAVRDKLVKNAHNYPADLCRGKFEKRNLPSGDS